MAVRSRLRRVVGRLLLVAGLALGMCAGAASSASANLPPVRAVQLMSAVDGKCLQAVNLFGHSLVYTQTCDGNSTQTWSFQCINPRPCEETPNDAIYKIVQQASGKCLTADHGGTPDTSDDVPRLGACLGEYANFAWHVSYSPAHGGLVIDRAGCLTRPDQTFLTLVSCRAAPAPNAIWRVHLVPPV